MRPTIPFSIFILCLLLGYQAGAFLGGVDFYGKNISLAPLPGKLSPLNPDNAATPAATLPNGQHSVLLIIADDLKSLSPRLESIWLMSYVANNTRLTFLPVYPTMSFSRPTTRPETGANPNLGQDELSALFQLTSSGAVTQLGEDFLQTVRQQIPWWGSTLILDRTALAEIEDAWVSHPSAADDSIDALKVNDLPHAWENPRAALLGQASIYQEMCWHAIRSETGPDFAGLFQRMPGHALSDIQGDRLQVEMNDLSVQMGRFACEFPTLAVPGSVISD